MNNSLGLVLKTTNIMDTGIGVESNILRAVKPLDVIEKFEISLNPQGFKSFIVEDGYRLSQFIVLSPQAEISMFINSVHPGDMGPDSFALRTSGLTLLNDSGITQIDIYNTTTAPIKLTVIFAKSRTS
jgi:hypothetical protein